MTIVRKSHRKKRQAVKEPACLNISEWRAATRQEVVEWVTRDRKPKKKKGGAILAVRSRLRPVDIYCYLKARFGEPNGFQNFLRKDDSDNWIHWDYSLKAGETDVYILGMSREIHIMVGEALTHQQWRDLIVGIRTDYARIGPQKSAVLQSLEKFVVFQNKFVSIAGLCADLHAAIIDAPAKTAFPERSPGAKSRLKTLEKAMQGVSTRANDLFGNCLKLHLLMPVMAEAFINMVILMFTRDEIRNAPEAYQAFIRAKIPDRLALLSQHCDGFARDIDKSTNAYAHFMRVIDKRNFALHGNVDPIREQIEVVYFDGRRPLFNMPGNHVERFFEHLEAIHRPEEIVSDYEAVHAFLWEITECLKPRTQTFFKQVIGDAYPGFEVHKKRATRILPDHVMMGMLPSVLYDDDLVVKW
ncbi:hypothetical protein LB534_10335 [Mesorhizobium sp. CA18]|uniref:hypothetical protein n=1 Tax=unclassified Mesorhizobium TaxID=325217 RepID=UPI001CCDCC4F|nr:MULTISPECIES: hypothetical protein [unclassified Mesorhizobium]MBZ9825677.1 hypothetical protein [Mesorhizobium sp. CA18]MBZ9831771.1 hypothetical protein [Mesorhizobium sp. CA2]MBZ9839120.1 hypothetical protein [Mesorhizobium sp. CA3]MBZ9878715.1 hypothetical protein [Mesorhizobium sp. Ca11]